MQIKVNLERKVFSQTDPMLDGAGFTKEVQRSRMLVCVVTVLEPRLWTPAKQQ